MRDRDHEGVLFVVLARAGCDGGWLDAIVRPCRGQGQPWKWASAWRRLSLAHRGWNCVRLETDRSALSLAACHEDKVVEALGKVDRVVNSQVRQ